MYAFRIAVILLALAILAGCARGGNGVVDNPHPPEAMTDEEIVESQVKETLEALKGNEVDKAFFYHSEDFVTERGKTLDATIETILDFGAGGFLDSLKIDFKNLEIEISGDKAEVKAILLDWSFGTMSMEMELERRGWFWVVTHSTDF